MKKYRGILFDLFATLALWHPDRLPRFTYQGKTVPSTMGELRHLISKLVTKASFEEFYSVFLQVNEAQAQYRANHLKEIPSRERFKATLLELGYSDDTETLEIAEEISLGHMALLAAVVSIPDEYSEFLNSLRQKYQLAVVSNFDHHATAHMILERGRIARHFDQIIISDSHGFRKPHEKIFTDTLKSMQLTVEDSLFVGDSWDDDVAGAHAIGMDVAWVNAKNQPPPNDAYTPTFEVAAITDLKDHLL